MGTAQQLLFLVLEVGLHAVVVISEVLRLSTKSRCSRCCGAHLYQRQAIEQLNDALCTASVLLFLDPRLPYTVVTDASGSAAGGVLMQDQGNGLQPLAFLSKQLKPTEQRYSAYERDLAAVAYCLQSWRHYLEGCLGGVTMATDHQPLTHYMDQPVLSRVQTRWFRLGLF